MTRSRLTPPQRADLIARYRNGALRTELAAAFDVSSSTVSSYTQGVSRSAAGAARIRALRQQAARHARSFRQPRLAAVDIQVLIGLWNTGAGAAELAARFGVSVSTIWKLTRGLRRWQVASAQHPRLPRPLPVPPSPATSILADRTAADPAAANGGQQPSNDARPVPAAVDDRRGGAPVRRSRWIAELIGPLQQVDDGHRHELIDGVARTRPLLDAEQTVIAGRIAASLGTYVTAQRLGRVERAAWCVLGWFPPTVLCAAVAYVRAMGADAWDGFFPLRPDLVVEVLSRTERYIDVVDRVEQWLAHGTRVVVVVQPRTRSVGVLEPQGITHLRGRQQLTGGAVVPDWRMPVGTLFR